MSKTTKTIVVIVAVYLAVCAFSYFFKRGSDDQGDTALEKFTQFIDPIGIHMSARQDEDQDR